MDSRIGVAEQNTVSTKGNSKDICQILEVYGSFVMDVFSPQSYLDVSINFSDRTSELSRETKLQVLKRFALNLCRDKDMLRMLNLSSVLGCQLANSMIKRPLLNVICQSKRNMAFKIHRSFTL